MQVSQNWTEDHVGVVLNDNIHDIRAEVRRVGDKFQWAVYEYNYGDFEYEIAGGGKTATQEQAQINSQQVMGMLVRI